MRVKRTFIRREPTRDAKKLFLFCEGAQREFQYFSFFKGIDSRIDLRVYKLSDRDDNSPTGLFKIAVGSFNDKKIDFNKDDEVWFVIDTDRWGTKIKQLRALIESKPNWHAAQSNPCFEVWLLGHSEKNAIPTSFLERCDSWREHVNSVFSGGFEYKSHAFHIGWAITYARENYSEIEEEPGVGATQVYRIGEIIHQFCGTKLSKMVSQSYKTL